ncbi:hypothetical protein RJ639_042580 [Escallonia herrerae]|uniref:PORR domain-containing protein n=1 Tax=Escallonia herrerae TaxID=1293975 RepID=A0AA88WFH0_9ASTE|nr:hypothetical protein RJ639_042580 [Escallonia herrerae]
MDAHKNLLKTSSSPSIEFLDRLSKKFHFNRGATAFLRHYPQIFHVFYNPTKSQPYFKLTKSATKIA